jgi:hypothetical protein
MPDFNVRSDSVNVEQIMDQIRARIREKRGVDYTEDQIKELAAVKLEKVLDPRGVRSDLLDQFRRSQPPPSPLTVPLYPFEDTTLFDSHRGIIRFFRRLFRPLLKLFFNSNALAQSLHQQTIINRQTVDRLDAMENSLRQNGELYYELLHNMVLELTRTTIEVKNAKMRVESIASRLEFNERRARALESAVVYRPAAIEREITPPPPPAAPPSAQPRGGNSYVPRENSRQPALPPVTPRPPVVATPPAAAAAPPAAVDGASGEGPGQRSRRRRRRRGRRGGGAPATALMTTGAPEDSDQSDGSEAESEAPAASGHEPGSAEPVDARHTRAEPLEHAFGAAAHPAEPGNAAPAESAPAVSSTPSSAHNSAPSAPEPHDDDGQ